MSVTAWQFWRGRRPGLPAISSGAKNIYPTDVVVGSKLGILSYFELVDILGLQSLLASIKRRSRFTDAHYVQTVEPLIHKLSEFVQLLPASESHHHAQPGGLLVHTLECANLALQFRAGCTLPEGLSSEQSRRFEHHATFALLVCALTHDIGKAVADVRVALYQSENAAPQVWQGLSGAMDRDQYRYYSVNFPLMKERDYSLHQKLPVFLVHLLVPAGAMRWLGQCPSLVADIFAILNGDKQDGVLANLVRKSDMESVKQNLADGPRTRFSRARAVPLVERLMEALRRILIEGHELPLNRAGAAGFVYQGEVWFYCKRVAGAVRDYLTKAESLEGVPQDDQKFWDAWQDYGAVIATPDGGAVWRGQVFLKGWQGPANQTFLRFPLGGLYSGAGSYPAEIEGRIEASSNQIVGQVVDSAVGAEVQVKPKTAAELKAEREERARKKNSAEFETAAPSSQQAAPVTETEQEFLPDDWAAQPEVKASGLDARELEGEERPVHFRDSGDEAPVQDVRPVVPVAVSQGEEASPTLDSQVNAPMRVVLPTAPVLKAKPSVKEGSQRLADAFISYVQAGIASGELPYNQSNAFYHFCQDGLLLTSPNTFRHYCEQFPERFEGLIEGFDVGGWQTIKGPGVLQRALLDTGWAKPLVSGYNVHTWQVGGNGAKLKCFLIPDPGRLFNPVPGVNEMLVRVPVEQQIEAAGNRITPQQRRALLQEN